jgi:hypothetical protein
VHCIHAYKIRGIFALSFKTFEVIEVSLTSVELNQVIDVGAINFGMTLDDFFCFGKKQFKCEILKFNFDLKSYK